jgi:hypothetical protein
MYYRSIYIFDAATRDNQQGMVKTSDVQPPAKRTKGDAQKFTNKSLPEGCQESHRWRRSLVPTYIHFVAACKNPWSVDSDEAVSALQKIWRAVYGDKIQHTVKVNEAVFSVVCLAACVMVSASTHCHG